MNLQKKVMLQNMNAERNVMTPTVLTMDPIVTGITCTSVGVDAVSTNSVTVTGVRRAVWDILQNIK